MSIVKSGRKAVVTNGTPLQLSGSEAAAWVVATAFTNNTNPVTVGGADVIGALATRKGIALAAGISTPRLDIDDIADIWVDSVTNGEGVTFAYACTAGA